jgi:hypothetical protein
LGSYWGESKEILYNCQYLILQGENKINNFISNLKSIHRGFFGCHPMWVRVGVYGIGTGCYSIVVLNIYLYYIGPPFAGRCRIFSATTATPYIIYYICCVVEDAL